MNLFNGIQKILKYAAEGYREGLEGKSPRKPSKPKKPLTPKPKASKVASEPVKKEPMPQATTEELVSHICDWSVNRINEGKLNDDDARAIYSEFEEWIDPDNDEINIFSLEPD
jgi:hypothetical protein